MELVPYREVQPSHSFWQTLCQGISGSSVQVSLFFSPPFQTCQICWKLTRPPHRFTPSRSFYVVLTEGHLVAFRLEQAERRKKQWSFSLLESYVSGLRVQTIYSPALFDLF